MSAISVIIPVYNVEKYLDRCLESLMQQTFQNFEIILIDDGSSDHSGAICDRWAEKDHRIQVIHKENGGQSSARNMGLKVAAGDYISFVDSDDWVEPGMFEYLYNLLEKHPNVQMAQCDMVVSKQYEMLDQQPEERIHTFNKKDMYDYFFRIHGEASNDAIWNRLYRKEVLEGFKFAPVKHEDVVACYEFFNRADRMIVSNQVFYHYFYNTEGVTRKFSENDLGYLRVWNYIVKRTSEEHPEYLYYAKMGRKRANYTVLAKMMINGFDKKNPELLAARKELKKKVRHDFWSLMRWKMPISRKILLILVCI